MAKKRKKVPKVELRDEFRKLNTREAKGHLHYVFEKFGKFFRSIGITHGKRTRGKKNIPLQNNPNPQDKQTAYARPLITKEEAKNYGKKLDDHVLSSEDKKMILELVANLDREEKPK